MWQDASRPLYEGMAVYPGDPGFKLTHIKHYDTDKHQLSTIFMSAHAGTHMDSPAHFIKGGKTIEELDSSLFFGPALLVAAKSDADVLAIPEGTVRVILRDEGFAGLNPECARALIKKGVKFIGTDRLSVTADDATLSVHVILLEREVIILEGMSLAGFEPGERELIALPARIPGSDGAPARAFIR